MPADRKRRSWRSRLQSRVAYLRALEAAGIALDAARAR